MAARKKKQEDAEFAVFAPSQRVLVRTWTGDLIRAAMSQADSGVMRLAVQLCDWLLTDDRVKSCLDSRLDALFGLVPTFDPAGDKRRSNRAVKALEGQEDWWVGWPKAELRKVVQWGILLNVAPFRHHWATVKDQSGRVQHGGRVLPFLRFWPQETLQFDFRKREWSTATEAGTRIPIVPNDGTWGLHCPRGSERPWADGLCWAIARWVLIKALAQQDQTRHGEKASMVVGTSPEGSTIEQRKKLAAEIIESGDEAVVLLAYGYDLKLLEVVANTDAIYGAQIRMADAAIAILFRGGDLTTQVGDKGSRAAAEVQERKGDNAKLKDDAEGLSDTTNGQSLNWWAEFNFGDSGLAPWPSYPVEPEEDKAKRATKDKTAAEGLDLHIKLGFGFDAKKYKDAYDLDYLTTWEKPEPVVPPALSGGDDKEDPKKGKKLPPPPAPPKPRSKASAAGLSAHLAKLTRFARAAGTSGQDDGQQYADDLAAEGQLAIADAIGTTIAAIEEELDAATGYEDLLERLRKRYENLDPNELVDVVESCMVLGELAGRLSVNLDN